MRIGIVGCGVMGGAIARIASQHHDVFLYDHKETNATLLAKETGSKIELDPKKFVSSIDSVFLAVKPKDLQKISEKIALHLKKGQIVMSILTGKTLKTLQRHFPAPFVFRVMPNLPLICGKGMLGIADDATISQEVKQKVIYALKGLGTISWLKEELFDAFMVLTSSNPAYFYLIIEAMVQAGVTLGFKPKDALEYLLQTIEGSVALIKHTGLTPTELKMRIMSPGGTTVAGLNEFASQRVPAGIIAGLQACHRRAGELGDA